MRLRPSGDSGVLSLHRNRRSGMRSSTRIIEAPEKLPVDSNPGSPTLSKTNPMFWNPRFWNIDSFQPKSGFCCAVRRPMEASEIFNLGGGRFETLALAAFDPTKGGNCYQFASFLWSKVVHISPWSLSPPSDLSPCSSSENPE